MNDAESVFPTSYAQRRLWVIQQMSPSSAAYNMVYSASLPDAPDKAVLQSALNALVKRHESLRTFFRFENEHPMQVIAPHGTIELQYCEARTKADVAPIASQLAAAPFELGTAPLVRALLTRVEQGGAVFTLVLHHIIADGQTIRILINELELLLRAHSAGWAPVLPELSIEYADYTVWQQRSLVGRRLEKLTDYWAGRLDGLAELQLHHDRPRPEHGSVRGGVRPLRVPMETVVRLRKLAAQEKTTLFAAFLAGFAALLSRLSRQSAFAIGLPVSGRTRPELERVTGLFINSIPFRVDLDPGITFKELVRRVGTDLANDLVHQDLPFELIVDKLNVKRRADRNPLFQLMIQLQVAESRQSAPGGDDQPFLESDKLSSQLDCSLILYETNTGTVEGNAIYSAELFDAETIDQIVGGFLRILENGSASSTQPIAGLPLLAESRRTEILALGAGPARDWSRDTLLHEWFTDCAKDFGSRLAVEAKDACVSFVDLDRRSNIVAANLQHLDVDHGAIIGICLPSSYAAIAAAVGVLKAGGAFLFLDPDSPVERRKYILSDCRAAAMIVPKGQTPVEVECPVVEFNDTTAQVASFQRANRSANDPAYVVYTSGSTGQPKGVVIPHRAVVNHMQWMLEAFPIDATDRVLLRTPLTFDASLWELWLPLLGGARLVVAPPGGHFDPSSIVETIIQEEITILQVVPSILRVLLELSDFSKCKSLRRVFCGGEVLTSHLVKRFFKTLPAELCNLYGPSETTIDATFHVCHPDDATPDVPIGRPIANVTARVLDERLQPVPPGVVGELFIGGSAVGTGYVNRPQLTEARFLPDPWDTGGTLFRTGDKALLLRNGNIQFIGRDDHQVKLRGFRIELGEIESALLSHPAVREAAAVVQEHGPGDQRLVAFVASSRLNGSELRSELLGWLRSRMPKYQVPSAIVVESSLPKTAHGKIDRTALAQRKTISGTASFKTAPRDQWERQTCECFEAALGLPRVDIDDDFFEIGGNSLLVVSVCAALQRATGIDVKVVDLFEHPTIRQLAGVLAARAQPRGA